MASYNHSREIEPECLYFVSSAKLKWTQCQWISSLITQNRKWCVTSFADVFSFWLVLVWCFQLAKQENLLTRIYSSLCCIKKMQYESPSSNNSNCNYYCGVLLIKKTRIRYSNCFTAVSHLAKQNKQVQFCSKEIKESRLLLG